MSNIKIQIKHESAKGKLAFVAKDFKDPVWTTFLKTYISKDFKEELYRDMKAYQQHETATDAGYLIEVWYV